MQVDSLKDGTRGKFEELQFLKGIAILLVVLVHTNLGIGDIHIIPEQLIRVGRWGCQLFFVISGFQLMMSWDKKEPQRGEFYLKRFIRIAPSYYLAVIFYGLLNIVVMNLCGVEKYCFTIKNDWVSLMMNVLLLHSFDPNSYNFVVPGGWYIGTQWVLYLCFPILASVYKRTLERPDRKKITRLLPIMALILNIVVQAVIAITHGSTELSMESTCLFYSALNQLPCFLIGVSLYFEYKNEKFKALSATKAISICMGLGFIASVMYFFMRKVPLIFAVIPTVYGYAFVGLIVFVFHMYGRISKVNVIKCITKWGGGILRSILYKSHYCNVSSMALCEAI